MLIVFWILWWIYWYDMKLFVFSSEVPSTFWTIALLKNDRAFREQTLRALFKHYGRALPTDAYLSMIWPALSLCRLKFKTCPETWPTLCHSPTSSCPQAVTLVMLYKCHASRDWQLGIRGELLACEHCLRVLCEWTETPWPLVLQRRSGKKKHWDCGAMFSIHRLVLKVLQNISKSPVPLKLFITRAGLCFEQCWRGTKLFVLQCGVVY